MRTASDKFCKISVSSQLGKPDDDGHKGQAGPEEPAVNDTSFYIFVLSIIYSSRRKCIRHLSMTQSYEYLGKCLQGISTSRTRMRSGFRELFHNQAKCGHQKSLRARRLGG